MKNKLFCLLVLTLTFFTGKEVVFAAGSREGARTEITTQKLKEHFEDGTEDEKEGIYIQSNGNNPYLLAIIKSPDENIYAGLYLYGPGSGWQEGDIKAIFVQGNNRHEFDVLWFSRTGRDNEKVKVVFGDDDSSFRLTIPGFFGRTDYYSKIFPYARGFARERGVTGTGFLLNNEGYIITNYHVIEGTRHILVRGIYGEFELAYPYTAVLTDKENDIAILKPEVSFLKPGDPSYSFVIEESNVGSSVFALGYPSRSLMGDEIKLTNGIISALSGFQGNKNLYQTTASVTPGNSGGPLFDERGNVIGINSAFLRTANNAYYAIKIKYVFELIKKSGFKINISNNNRFDSIWRSNLAEITKEVKDFVYMIEAF
jgi:S1-C subfamily serine protease